MARLQDILWPEARIQALQAYLAEKLSAQEIADHLGVTRNAVLGKIHRMGLRILRDGNGHPPAPRKALRRVAPRRFVVLIEKEEASMPEPQVFEVATPLSIVDLEAHQCHYPLEVRGDDGLRLYCGRITLASSAYCHEHYRVVYTTARR